MKKPAFTPDFSAVAYGRGTAKHLAGGLIEGPWGKTLFLTAAHLGPKDGQQISTPTGIFTLKNVRRLVLGGKPGSPGAPPDGGDVAVAEIVETLPREQTRYSLAGVSSGTGYVLQASGATVKFAFVPVAGVRRWCRGSRRNPFRFLRGVSGRLVLVQGADGKTLASGPMSRIAWGEWGTPRFEDLLT
jgi:hypothetical protein